jgi:hypothetical protein
MKVVQPLPIWEIKDPEIIKEMDMPEYGGTEIYSSSGEPWRFTFAVNLYFTQPELIHGLDIFFTLNRLQILTEGILEIFRPFFTPFESKESANS